jgi:four helix bundle protein
MKELLLKTFDFGIRVTELSNYLDEEKKRFPLMNRLLECGTGICVCMRISETQQKSRSEHYAVAYKLVVETEYLLELMAKTGFLTEPQSKPILADCESIRDEIEKIMYKK